MNEDNVDIEMNEEMNREMDMLDHAMVAFESSVSKTRRGDRGCGKTELCQSSLKAVN